MRIAICDDDPSAAYELSATVIDFDVTWKITLYQSTDKLLSDYRSGFRVDVVFMNINMLGIDGINAAMQLKTEYTLDCPMIIFAAISLDHMIKGYRIARDYRTMPFISAEIAKNLSNIKINLQKQRICIPSDRKTVIIEASDIMYIEVFNHNLSIQLRNGKIVTSRSTLKNILKLLSSNDFVQIHRSIVVNMQYIVEYDNSQICMLNGKRLPYSQKRAEDYYKAIESFVKNTDNRRIGKQPPHQHQPLDLKSPLPRG